MEFKDWYDCGAKIGDLVQSAIEKGDYGRLNADIIDVIGKSLEDLGSMMGLHDAGKKEQGPGAARERSAAGGRENTGADPYEGRRSPFGEFRSKETAYSQAGKRVLEEGRRLLEREDLSIPPKLKGVLSMALGYGTAGVFGLGTIAMGLLSWVTGFGLFRILTLLLLVLTGVFIAIGKKGGTTRDRQRRLDQYMQVLGGREACTLQEIAAATGRDASYVAADLKGMIRDGMFPGTAYLDEEETMLMTSHEAYAAYQNWKQRQQEQKREREASQQRSAMEREATEKDLENYSEETREILREGRSFIAHIHRANEAIPDEGLTEKLDRLENVVARIFEQVAARPDSAPDMHKMMRYYLPITRKLVDAYVELDAQKVQGKNVTKTKKEIADSLDTINTAFEAMLDSFFEDTAWDISSDISALQAMMARDGLTGRNDFGPGSHTASAGKDFGTGKAAGSAAGGSGAVGKAAAGRGAAAAAAKQEEE